MRLIICPASQVTAALRDRAPSHIVSLISPDTDDPQFNLPSERHLILRFNDIAEPRPGLTAPSEAAVEQLIAFTRDEPQQRSVLIHCYAGISRSPAAAYIIACAAAGPGCEAELAGRLRRKSPQATPNPWLVALADAELARSGAMVRAIASLGRGVEAFEGACFEYP